jgi:hypothetical protein
MCKTERCNSTNFVNIVSNRITFAEGAWKSGCEMEVEIYNGIQC